ncbi:MAG: Uma2 family endonuclease [Verrucomicrobiaceae bacterium]|nr:Uma2 family endonuclease [Verrucomicrobiaceae bacterium]
MSATATIRPPREDFVLIPRSKGGVPALEQGDRLSRQEFHRRYESMTNVKKAELIEGVVNMPSPAKLKKHGKPQIAMAGWLVNYAAQHPKTEAADNATVMLDFDNEYQPDLLLRILPEHGGQSRTTAEDYVEGAPELAVEIASSSAGYDLHAKKNAYRRNGVREYLVWITQENRIVWWKLVEGEFVEIEPDADGLLKSSIFPGLWLDAAAMLEGDLAKVLSRLQDGMRSAA